MTNGPPTGSDDELNLGLLLFIPYRDLENRVLAALAAAGFDDVTIAQARVFQRIGPTGTRLTDLAQAAQVSKQTAGFLVDQLEKSGYVERVQHPSDARARLVRVTARGNSVIAVGAAVIADTEAEWTAHVGSKNMAQLRASLSALREITDRYR